MGWKVFRRPGARSWVTNRRTVIAVRQVEARLSSLSTFVSISSEYAPWCCRLAQRPSVSKAVHKYYELQHAGRPNRKMRGQAAISCNCVVNMRMLRHNGTHGRNINIFAMPSTAASSSSSRRFYHAYSPILVVDIFDGILCDCLNQHACHFTGLPGNSLLLPSVFK